MSGRYIGDLTASARQRLLKEPDTLFTQIHERLDEEYPPLPPSLLLPPDLPDEFESLANPGLAERILELMPPVAWLLVCLLLGVVAGGLAALW